MISVKKHPKGVATITLDRAEKHNALSGQMIRDLHAAALELGNDRDVRAVVLRGEGKNFCAGADLGWMRAQFEAAPGDRRKEAEALAFMLSALNAIPKPLIARVQGSALGGGMGLISVADIVVAEPESKFALTEVKLGLIPATIGPYVAARIGAAAARRNFFSGRLMNADEALAAGFLTRIVAAEDLDSAVDEEVSPFYKAAPGAVGAAKALYHRLSGAPSPEEISATIDALLTRWEDEETISGVSAFFERRPPPWSV